ncbi:FAD-binding domain-containing protein [Lutimaribacter saemankumensis]|uniref:Deoxyribodipyrimidine photo-lyase n=1 Tax=Lutimaribacter saemankumensis TaxID=490829 RepID=A0A1G8I9T8_9RHOB|nr:FAD-binding domain-containing protein [Lutimaribacter saemankumensis]SDI15521.1 deoxyribodipyrimidine photo-lyase [Lutimaribacter saemankumensis]
MTDTVICWFKRDLRLHDNAALARAAALGSVIPLYIVEPALWAQSDASGRQFDFLRESLIDLDADLQKHGARLVVRQGDAPDVLERLRRDHGVRHLVSHEETGNGWTYARDRRVAEWARGQGVAWHELPQSGVVRRLAGRNGWAARREAFVRQPQVRVEGLRFASGIESDPVPDAQAMALDDPCPGRQAGGRLAALRTLDGFLHARGKDYRSAMSSPLTGEDACSRLSPHLAFGTLSVREVAQAAQARAAQVKGQRGWPGSVRSFQSRLAWRDHFMQKLEDEPGLEHYCLHPAYEGLRPPEADAARLHAWAEGQTGLPFVDACMRYLRATGWLNFRMRSMVVAVASYHLWLDWRATGPVLARYFTDYEPGIHWSQMQMQSGTTGMNTIRIYNPVKQGHDQDPDGVFTRRWVPELSEVPDDYLQEPWRWPQAGRVLGRTYPEPLVDVKRAAAAARDAVWAVRKRDGFRQTAQRIVEKHASRKDRAGHFTRDPEPRPAEDRQLRLDL